MRASFYAVRYDWPNGRTDFSRSFAKVRNARKLAEELSKRFANVRVEKMHAFSANSGVKDNG